MIVMHILKRINAFALVAVIVIAPTIGTMVTAQAAASSPAQAAIAARQAGYKKMGAAIKVLNDQLKTKAPAKDIMLSAARTVAMTAREQPRLFPAGSGSTAGVHTDALPNIWTDRATFDGYMNRLLAESGKLVTVAGSGDATAIRAQFKATAATCSTCHRSFRADS